jgi:hypothetical protein
MKNFLLLLGLALLVPGRAALAQSKPIKAGASRVVAGLVRNGRTADPVARVRVQVQGDTAVNTLTDTWGRFKLLVPNAAQATLEFEKYGYVSQAQTLATQTKPELRIWFDRTPTNWKSQKALARDSAKRARQTAPQQAAIGR